MKLRRHCLWSCEDVVGEDKGEEDEEDDGGRGKKVTSSRRDGGGKPHATAARKTATHFFLPVSLSRVHDCAAKMLEDDVVGDGRCASERVRDIIQDERSQTACCACVNLCRP